MTSDGNSFVKAVELISAFDPSTMSAVLATLLSSGLALLVCVILGVPLGFALGFYSFRGKQAVRTLVNTLLSFPTVVIGLLVYMLLSRQGPMGSLGLPLVVSLAATAVESADERLRLTLLTFGASPRQMLITYIFELRFPLLMALATVLGRIISEVGIAMIVGGNIKWHTRTMTTAISLETGKGDFSTALALGMILLGLALLINLFISVLQLADRGRS